MSPNIRRVVARFGAALAFGAPLAVLAADHGVLFRFESGLSPKQMGAVMAAIMAEVGGKADGKLVNQVVRRLLSSETK